MAWHGMPCHAMAHGMLSYRKLLTQPMELGCVGLHYAESTCKGLSMHPLPRTEYHATRSVANYLRHPATMAIGLAVLMSLLISLLWSLWWPLGACLAWACFQASLQPLQYPETQHMVGALLVAGVVAGVGAIFGPMAAGCTSFILLLPLGLAALGQQGERAEAVY
jgi:hypothetical protein